MKKGFKTDRDILFTCDGLGKKAKEEALNRILSEHIAKMSKTNKKKEEE